MVGALVLVSPAVLNPLDSKFVLGRDPNANLFTPIANLRTRVETTARLAAFNLQVWHPFAFLKFHDEMHLMPWQWRKGSYLVFLRFLEELENLT